MNKVKHLATKDLPFLQKTISRVEEVCRLEGKTIPYFPKDKEFYSFFENEAIFQLSEGVRCKAFAFIEHSVSFYFRGPEKRRKIDDIFDIFEYSGEMVTVLAAFDVDPMCSYSAEGKELLQSLFAKYKGSSWIAAVKEGEDEKMAFLQSQGFLNRGLYDDIELEGSYYLLIKQYKKLGLCRELSW